MNMIRTSVGLGCGHLKAFLEMEDLLPKMPTDTANKLILAVGVRLQFLHTRPSPQSCLSVLIVW